MAMSASASTFCKFDILSFDGPGTTWTAEFGLWVDVISFDEQDVRFLAVNARIGSSPCIVVFFEGLSNFVRVNGFANGAFCFLSVGSVEALCEAEKWFCLAAPLTLFEFRQQDWIEIFEVFGLEFSSLLIILSFTVFAL